MSVCYHFASRKPLQWLKHQAINYFLCVYNLVVDFGLPLRTSMCVHCVYPVLSELL